MNIFYLESGALKFGRVLNEAGSSIQVQTQHGKKIKVKANHALLTFDDCDLDLFSQTVEKISITIDPDLLWEGFNGEESSFEAVCKTYFGSSANTEQYASVLTVLFNHPTHFYKKGKGLFKPASPEALAAAKASLELKKQKELTLKGYIEKLMKLEVPKEFNAVINRLIHGPDKNETEEKALDKVCAIREVGRQTLLENLGVMPIPEAFHLGQFLFDHPTFEAYQGIEDEATIGALPVSNIDAFSIDDAATTEIDDAFSIISEGLDGWRLGIHIAAPALGIQPDSQIDKKLRTRMSTVYHPNGKFTMCPPDVIEKYSLMEAREVPVASLYVTFDKDFRILGKRTVFERIKVSDNLDLKEVETYFDPDRKMKQLPNCPRGDSLFVLFQLACQLRQNRGEKKDHLHRTEYSYDITNGNVVIAPRKRGSPVDTIVSELMILANSTWASDLKNAEKAALFRVKTKSRSGLAIEPLPHETMGVETYAWLTRPLRRYIDLINQRLLMNVHAPNSSNEDLSVSALQELLTNFEKKHGQYVEFQRQMERFWCLKWILQAGQRVFDAELINENMVKLKCIPLVCRVKNFPEGFANKSVKIRVGRINLYDNTLVAEWIEND